MTVRIPVAALVATLALLVAPPAHAEVTAKSRDGFVVRHVVTVPVPPADAWRRFVAIGGWWSDAHTYSGAARNLQLTPRPGGCWCERLPGRGFVRHLDVIYAAPGATLRMTGGLGPLQGETVNGVMTVSFAPDGAGARVTLTYAVGGFMPDGVDSMAAPVDGVLAEAMQNYAKAAGARP